MNESRTGVCAICSGHRCNVGSYEDRLKPWDMVRYSELLGIELHGNCLKRMTEQAGELIGFDLSPILPLALGENLDRIETHDPLWDINRSYRKG